MNLRAEVAILGVRLDGLAGDLLEGRPIPDLEEIQSIAREIDGAIQHGDMTRLNRANAKLKDVVKLTQAEADSWREYRSTVKDLAALVSSQSSRDLAERNMIPASVVWRFVEMNQNLMFQFVPDSVQRNAYMRQLEAMIGPGPATQLIEAQFQEPEEIS